MSSSIFCKFTRKAINISSNTCILSNRQIASSQVINSEKKLQVFINKCDAADEEMIELVEMEVRELLTEMGFDGDEVPVVKGSALCALEDKSPEMGVDAVAKLMGKTTVYEGVVPT